MGISYNQIALPLRSVTRQWAPESSPHARFNLFDRKGANIGQLTVLAEDAHDYLRLFAESDETCKVVTKKDGEVIHHYKELRYGGKTVLLSEYGDLVRADILFAKHPVVTVPEEWDHYRATGVAPEYVQQFEEPK